VTLTASCVTSTPQVAKIGLIAPFEGLHRESGYAALDGLRAALDECGELDREADIAFVPLALNDSYQAADAARALAKVRVDPAVVAILGPLSPGLVMRGQAPETTTRAASRPSHLFPFLVDESGRFADEHTWPRALAHYIFQVAQVAPMHTSATRLLVAGAPEALLAESDTWLQAVAVQMDDGDDAQSNALLVSDLSAIPIVIVPQNEAGWAARLETVYEMGDALLWLDPTLEGLAELVAVHHTWPDLSIVFGPDANHTKAATHFNVQAPLFWGVWSDDGYTEWAMRHMDESRGGLQADGGRDTYLIYLAACSAILELSGNLLPGISAPEFRLTVPREWHLHWSALAR
jgi:hypothetical protein